MEISLHELSTDVLRHRLIALLPLHNVVRLALSCRDYNFDIWQYVTHIDLSRQDTKPFISASGISYLALRRMLRHVDEIRFMDIEGQKLSTDFCGAFRSLTLSCANSLTRIKIESDKVIDLLPPKLFSRRGREIQSLSLRGMNFVTEEFLSLITKSCPNLLSLTLMQGDTSTIRVQPATAAKLICQLQSLQKFSTNIPDINYRSFKTLSNLTKLSVNERVDLLYDLDRNPLDKSKLDAVMQELKQDLPPKLELCNFRFYDMDLFSFFYNRSPSIKVLNYFDNYPGYNLRLDANFVHNNLSAPHGDEHSIQLFHRILAAWSPDVISSDSQPWTLYSTHMRLCERLLSSLAEKVHSPDITNCILDAVATRLNDKDRLQVGKYWFGHSLHTLQRMQRIIELDSPKGLFGIAKIISDEKDPILGEIIREYGHNATADLFARIDLVVAHGAKLKPGPHSIANSPLGVAVSPAVLQYLVSKFPESIRFDYIREDVAVRVISNIYRQNDLCEAFLRPLMTTPSTPEAPKYQFAASTVKSIMRYAVATQTLDFGFLNFLRFKCGIEHPITPSLFPAPNMIDKLVLQKFCHRLVAKASLDEEDDLIYYIKSIFSFNFFDHDWKPAVSQLRKRKLTRAQAELQALLAAAK